MATEVLNAQKQKSKASFGFIPPEPQTYSIEALRLAYNVEMATGQIILNPHNMNVQSLVDIDEDWLQDRAIFLEFIEFAEDNMKTGELINGLLGGSSGS